MIPAAILDTFAAVTLLVAAVSAARLAVGRALRLSGVDADVDLAHVLMGIAMAGMLSPGLQSLPGGAWEVIFGALTALFTWKVAGETRGRAIRALPGAHHTPHLIHSAAMLYMFLALSAPASGGEASGMGGMSGSSGMTLHVPTLALVFALLLAGYAVRDLDQLTSTPRPASLAVRSAATGPGTAAVVASAPSIVLPAARIMAPQVVAGCRIAMGITMALMLIIAI